MSEFGEDSAGLLMPAGNDAPSVLWDTVWRFVDGKGIVGDWEIVPEVPLTEDAVARLAIDPFADVDPYANTLHAKNTGGFKANDKLGTAVLIALLTNARLPNYMLARYGFTVADQHEWHGNGYSVDNVDGEEPLGSLLWLLRRAPATDYTCRLAESFAAAALQPLVRQKKASSFEIIAQIDKKTSMLQLYVRAYGPEEREWFADLFPLQ